MIYIPLVIIDYKCVEFIERALSAHKIASSCFLRPLKTSTNRLKRIFILLVNNYKRLFESI